MMPWKNILEDIEVFDVEMIIQIYIISNNIRMQRSVAPSTGNARGARKQSLISWVSVHNTPLPKQHQNK